MIQTERIAEPSALTNNKSKWQKAYDIALIRYNILKSKNNKKKLKTAESKYNNRHIKSALKSIFDGKCAYCESHVTHMDYGNIDHYKPKSKFPALCLDWSNLL